jgi:hypothetical protein
MRVFIYQAMNKQVLYKLLHIRAPSSMRGLIKVTGIPLDKEASTKLETEGSLRATEAIK